MTEPKYPHITVQLTGIDGNAMSIIGAVQRALKKNEVGAVECRQFVEEAMSGDYDKVIQTACKWVEVE